MNCFGKWGHQWGRCEESEKNEIIEKLRLFGIKASSLQVCSKCSRIKAVVTTIMDPQPKTVILPPFPRE